MRHFTSSHNHRQLGCSSDAVLQVGNAADFIPVFLSAKNKGLKVASHLAEVQLAKNVPPTPTPSKVPGGGSTVKTNLLQK